MKCISTRENRCGLRCGLINTDCVEMYEIKDQVWDKVEYEVSIQVRDQVWGYLYYLIRYEVRLKVWFD